MKFKNIKSIRLSDKVAEEIIMMIENGQLKPGDKLPTETVLAEKMGISRGILREALTILQYKGYISRKPKDGTYIRELSESNFINNSLLKSFKRATYKDLIQMREALEQKVVELAVKSASDKEIEEMEEFLTNVNLSDDKNLLDYNFHLKLAELSKNILLINFIDIYYDLIRELGESSFRNKKRRSEVIQEHKYIIRKIKSRDEDAAKDAIMKHLSMVEKSIECIDINKTIDLGIV
ncbi:FadR/GntR family transcriptional regulator [Clostridium sediminicola]|uniref:FadR/GntR family transcriptional regulator n=1 Tax=Clostridium sediminicola TaxID=3114879 RepID=UPI0031F1D1C0